MLSSVKPPVRMSMPIAIRMPPAGDDDRTVVALDHRKRGRGARKGEGGDQERDREAERVDGQEEGAVGGFALDPGERQDAAERRAGARRPGDREGRSGDDRAALACARQQRVDAPVAIQPVDEASRR